LNFEIGAFEFVSGFDFRVLLFQPKIQQFLVGFIFRFKIDLEKKQDESYNLKFGV
jgi:hypothetical protein